MSFKVKAWNDGSFNDDGTGFGIIISEGNRNKYFDEAWTTINLHINNQEYEIALEGDFWTENSVIKHQEIGKFLIANGNTMWGRGKPPTVEFKILSHQEFSLKKQRAAKKMHYNLNGLGPLNLYIYPHVEKLFEVLCHYHYDAKLNNTNQLGALRRVLPGAHYTRYEYILLQWYLIHELKTKTKDNGLGSTSQVLSELAVEGYGNITGGDLLQCIALLSNIGHFPDTFSASRVWLHLLKKNHKNTKKGMKAGLQSTERTQLNKILDDCNVYNMHLVNAMFLVNRHKSVGANKPILDMASTILAEYLEGSESSYSKYWDIYGMIRKISYLILDSSYAPIPLNIDIYSIVSNFDLLFGKHLESDSTFNTAIKQLDKVMQDSIYMNGNSLIATAIRSSEIENKFIEHEEDEINIGGTKHRNVFHRISIIKDLLEPQHKQSNSLSEIFNEYSHYRNPMIEWDTDNCLELQYSNTKIYSSLFPTEDYVWEKQLHERCRKTHCLVGVFRNPRKDEIRVAYSRNINKSLVNQYQSLNHFTSEYLRLREGFRESDYVNPHGLLNLKRIVEYHLKGIFGWAYDITFEWTKLKDTNRIPFITGRGFRAVSTEIDEYITEAEGQVNDDMMHEFKCTHDAVRNTEYGGRFVVFIGSTKVWGNEPTSIAEFDGIVIYPNERDGVLIDIIEAKNYTNGFTDAQRQLRSRMKKRQSSFSSEINDVNGRSACASIKFVEN